jgi:dTMP kinase
MKNRSTRGMFVVLDGGDGGGKTGAAVFISNALARLGIPAVLTREPGGTAEGQELRQLLLSSQSRWVPMADLLLMNAARVQHVTKVIVPAVERGDIVVCDRFVSSTLAYQHAGHGIGKDVVLDIHRLSTGDLWPDLTIILDIDPEIGLARSRKRLAAGALDEGRFENLDLEFHRRVRNSFLEQSLDRPESYVVVDASQPPEQVYEKVWVQIQARLHAN